MKKAITEELGKAAYEARCEKLISGAYRNSAVRVPDQDHFYEWDGIPDYIESAVKWLYRASGEASLYAFFAYVEKNGSPEAKAALDTLLNETKTLLYTDEELARLEAASQTARA